MRIIRTHEQSPNSLLDQFERDQVYNGLDCAITLEVLEATLPQLDADTSRTYAFSRALQGPALEMRLRGVLVDQRRKAEVIDAFYDQIDQLDRQLHRIVGDGVGVLRFNWRSPADLADLFYNKLGLPPIRKKGSITTDRKALEKLWLYIRARQIVNHILKMRDLAKKISVLQTEIDHDGRMRTSYNIAGTSTGRFSSSFSEFGTGGNLQNVEESLRSIFIADPGYKFAKLDAKSGESYCVGGIEWNLFKDGRYLDAVETGDVHTAVARICWPNLGWTNNLKQDKHLAEQPYYRHYTYRFMCKKLGHGSNYGGEPDTLASQSELPVRVVQLFQPSYFKAFPAHLEWQRWVASTIRRDGKLTSLTGRRRQFMGRRSDPSTIREAIAYDPQGSLADIVNTGMLRVWRSRKAILVMHDHDATTWMYPEECESEVVAYLQQHLTHEIPLSHNRTLSIPYDCKTGWNKGDYNAQTNPDGLKDYVGEDKRERSKEVGIMDRVIRRKHG